jgi:phage portal protein BeeE
MEEDKNHTVVEQVLSELGGQPMRVKFTVVAGDREGKEQQNEASRREKLLNNPVVHEAIERYGARIVDIQ